VAAYDRQRIPEIVRDEPHQLISCLDRRLSLRPGGAFGGVQARPLECLCALLGQGHHEGLLRCIKNPLTSEAEPQPTDCPAFET
jgi:hypothetical protein